MQNPVFNHHGNYTEITINSIKYLLEKPSSRYFIHALKEKKND